MILKVSICDALRDLKNVKNTHEVVLGLVNIMLLKVILFHRRFLCSLNCTTVSELLKASHMLLVFLTILFNMILRFTWKTYYTFKHSERN